MKNALITGGTGFVSRYAAEYYVKKGYCVSVLNRNNKKQAEGVTLLKSDRHELGNRLRGHHFDVVFDITAKTAEDINLLLNALESYEDYIFISSSAVYPEHLPQPFTEQMPLGVNKFWGKYGLDKIEAEQVLMKRAPAAYILRPPYLYGAMNNVYREAFVFECALNDRKFYLPQDGRMKLQFLHIHDLCRFMDILLERKPAMQIFNVGNREAISICDWVSLCYRIAGKDVEFINVDSSIEQRNYFSFYNYEYRLDVSNQEMLMPETTALEEGIRESFDWYRKHSEEVNRKPLMEFIDANFV